MALDTQDNLANLADLNEGNAVRQSLYLYDEVGLPLSITYPAATDIVAEFQSEGNARGWNENGQLLHLRYLKGGLPLREFEFEYDDSGNRTRQIETSSAGSVHWRYSYDYLDRLSKVEKGPSESLLEDVSIYSYDESDNRTVLDLPQDLVKLIYSYDDADGIETLEKRNLSTNALLSTESFELDDDGNLLSRFNDDTGLTISYSWDGFNKLVSVSSADSNGPTNDVKQENSYLANGFRRKKKAKSGQVTTEYSTGLSTALAKAGADTISYIQGPQILGFEKNEEFFFFLTDALGSVRDIVRGTDGVVLQSYDYTENGNKTASTSFQSDKTWVGGLSVNDDTVDSGLYLMGHRHYDSSLGRFLSRDPIGFAGGLNLYSMAANNPVTYTDHTGLMPTMTADGVKDIAVGTLQIIGGVGAAASDAPLPFGDAVGAGLVVDGQRRVRRGFAKILGSSVPLPGSSPQPRPSPSASPGPSPSPCPGDGDEDDTLLWRKKMRRVAPHFYGGLAGPDVQLTKDEFQEIILEHQARYVSTRKSNGYETWRINEFGNSGRELEFVFDPKPQRGRSGAVYPGAFVTIYGTGRRR